MQCSAVKKGNTVYKSSAEEEHCSAVHLTVMGLASVCSLCPIDHKLSLLRTLMITMTMTVMMTVMIGHFYHDGDDGDDKTPQSSMWLIGMGLQESSQSTYLIQLYPLGLIFWCQKFTNLLMIVSCIDEEADFVQKSPSSDHIVWLRTFFSSQTFYSVQKFFST